MIRPPVLSELPFHRRRAKRLAKESGLKLAEAQNRIALQLGFQQWSLMVKFCNSPQAPETIAEHDAWIDDDLHRSYIHGDQYEFDATRFLCARCSCFVDASHFKGLGFHGDGFDVDIYIIGMEAETRRIEPSTEYFRPLYGANILAARAAARKSPDESSPCAEFHCWLQQQSGREDCIGIFSRFAMRDSSFPRMAKTLNEIITYLGGEGSWFYCDARDAWNEYALAQAYIKRRRVFEFSRAIVES